MHTVTARSRCQEEAGLRAPLILAPAHGRSTVRDRNGDRSRRALLLPLLLLLCLPLLPDAAVAQNPNSPVFRNYQPPRLFRPSRYSGMSRQWTAFMLQREANSGDPLAQFELGLRYLYGIGFDVDTLQAAQWVARAAAQNHVPARFNLAIMLYNGWGVSWNPFEAEKHFRFAAERGMPEAQHAMGVLYLNNLVFDRDYRTASDWIEKSAAGEYAPAIKAKQALRRFGHIKDTVSSAAVDGSLAALPKDTVATSGSSPPGKEDQEDEERYAGWTPIFLDFGLDTATSSIETVELIEEFLGSIELSAADSTKLSSLLADSAAIDSSALEALRGYAAWNNPEAVILLGRCYEQGILLQRDAMRAASHFVRGVFLDSPRGAGLLINQLRNSDVYTLVEKNAFGGSAEAQFVWAALAALELDRRPTESMALDLLKRSSAQGNTHAMVQLGLGYFTGRWVKRDREAAVALWQRAASLGDREGAERLASAVVLGVVPTQDVQAALDLLTEGAGKGSMLAQVALAYSYEYGVGRSANRGIAALLYRGCYARGSQNAFRALQRMHDTQRPAPEPSTSP